MKIRILITLSVICTFQLLIFLLPSEITKNEFETSVLGYNTVDLNIRSRPDIKSRKKSVLTKNSEILISNIISNNWGLIGTKDSLKLGYVSLSFIKDINSNPVEFDEIKSKPSSNSGSLSFIILIQITLYVYLIWLFFNRFYIKNKPHIRIYSEGVNNSKSNLIRIIRNSIDIKQTSFSLTNKISTLNRFGVYISSWNKVSGDEVKTGDKICTLIIGGEYYIHIESKMKGILEIFKSEHTVDGNSNEYKLNPKDKFFTIHDYNSFEIPNNLIDKRIEFKETIQGDEFTNSVELTWKKVKGSPLLSYKYLNKTQNPNDKIYTYRDGFLVKKGNWEDDLQLRFTFNYTNENDFIIFKYNTTNPYKFKHGTSVSLKFDNNEIISFQINKPYKNLNEDLFQSKSILTESTLNTFKTSKLIRWKITPSENSESIEGKINNTKSQEILKQFTLKYLNLVKSNVVDYEEKKKSNSIEINSNQSSEDCFVYLMIDTTNSYHKIGISNSPEYREKTLQSEKPTIELICSKSFLNRKMCLTIEQSLHKTFESKRLRGEWFKLDDKDVEDVKKVLS